MREWTYARRIGGLMRCCLGSLDCQMVTRQAASEGPPQDGDTFITSCCGVPLVHRAGAWEWDRGKKSALNWEYVVDTRAAA